MNSSYVAPFLSHAINHVWQSTLLAFVAWLVVLTLLRRNSPHARYGVWLASSVKFLIPFAALVDLGSRLGFMRLAARQTQARMYYAMDEVSRRFAPQFVPSALRPTIPAPGSPLPRLLLLAWICGVAVAATRWWLRWLQVRTAVRAAAPLRTDEGVPVLSSPALRERGLEPGVFGLLRPVILVPEGIADRLSPEQFEAVLNHEVCHARRRDNLAAAVHMLVEALFWFHPLVWWLGRKMTEERERACDDEVLRRCNDPATYAQGILNVCKFYIESPLRCVAGATGSNLKQRIEEIMTHRSACKLGFAKKVLLTTALAGAVAGPVWVGLLHAPLLHAQAPATNQQFEVASIKPNNSGENNFSIRIKPGGRMVASNASLWMLITATYQVQDYQLSGGPAWLKSARFDIDAKGPFKPDIPVNDQISQMGQALLADRFQLKLHREAKEMPVYALLAAKNGPKLDPARGGNCFDPTAGIPPPAPDARPCGGFNMNNDRLLGAAIPMERMARALSRFVGRPVVDKTGLGGTFDITLHWTPDDAPSSSDPSIFTALQEQLGLRLESQKGPVEVLVIDSAQLPSAN
jgi:bla regulator protein blaR1